MALSPVTKEEKISWVQGPGKDTYVAAYANSFPEFFNTSCVLTSAVLRYRISGKLDWTPVYYSEESSGSWPLPREFQVSLGSDGDYDNHHFIVVDGTIYQSWWKKTSWDSRPFPEEGLPYRKLKSEELLKITGFTFSEDLDYVISIP